MGFRTVETEPIVVIDAKDGRGCDHCETGVPITRVRYGRCIVDLCLECTMLWFPGKTIEWFETQHAPYRDHLGRALEKAFEAQLARP